MRRRKFNLLSASYRYIRTCKYLRYRLTQVSGYVVISARSTVPDVLTRKVLVRLYQVSGSCVDLFGVHLELLMVSGGALRWCVC